MTDLDPGALASLLDDVRRELGEAVDELDRSRAAHRTVESLLLAVLEHVPVPIVVVDEELRVRATGAVAEEAWGVSLDGFLTAAEPLADAGVPDACRAAFEAGHVAAAVVPSDYGMAMLDEPGTPDRYIAVWAGRSAA